MCSGFVFNHIHRKRVKAFLRSKVACILYVCWEMSNCSKQVENSELENSTQLNALTLQNAIMQLECLQYETKRIHYYFFSLSLYVRLWTTAGGATDAQLTSELGSVTESFGCSESRSLKAARQRRNGMEKPTHASVLRMRVDYFLVVGGARRELWQNRGVCVRSEAEADLSVLSPV